MKFIRCVGTLLAITWLCHTGLAATLYTEPHGAASSNGLGIASWAYVGIRFELEQPAQLTALNAEMGLASSSFFAALVQLPSVTSLPQGNPFAPGEVLYSTVFSLDSGTVSPWHIPFTVSVDPGVYGIVFGAGLFGSGQDFAVAGTYESVLGSTAFSWDGFAWAPGTSAPMNWQDSPSLTLNVSVEGIAVPEPSTLFFLLVGGGIFGVLRMRCRGRALPR